MSRLLYLKLMLKAKEVTFSFYIAKISPLQEEAAATKGLVIRWLWLEHVGG